MAKLYIVPTPIGNLKDITIRSLEILQLVDCIACEDTRVSIKLLNHYNIKKPLIAHHIFNEKNSSMGIINLLSEGKNVALISDAGMPIIADPGFKLLSEVKKHGFEFEILPGASASILTFAYSSLGNTYCFLGFLEAKSSQRKKQLFSLAKGVYVAFISPYKLEASMADFDEIFQDQVEIYLVKELTKLNEKHFSGSPKEVIAQLKNSSLKGEFSICFKIK